MGASWAADPKERLVPRWLQRLRVSGATIVFHAQEAPSWAPPGPRSPRRGWFHAGSSKRRRSRAAPTKALGAARASRSPSVQLRGLTPKGYYSIVLEGFGLDFATVTRIQARTMVGNPDRP